MQELVAHVQCDTFEAFMEARRRLQEAQLTQQLEEQMRQYKARVGKELRDSITPARNHIVQEILTLHCPRCGGAFLDFDGCLALSCPAPGCACGFCVVCLEDCGNDAHAHVRACKYANTAGRAHAATDDIRRAQNAWRLEKLREFIMPLSAHLAQRVLLSLKQEFQDLGLDASELLGGLDVEVRCRTDLCRLSCTRCRSGPTLQSVSSTACLSYLKREVIRPVWSELETLRIPAAHS
jgi:hypothetical protein